MIYREMPGEEGKVVNVVDLLRNVIPHKYWVVTDDEDMFSIMCIREQLSVCQDDPREHFKCGTCLETYHKRSGLELIDMCTGCGCTICANCNGHAYLIFDFNHCRHCRINNPAIKEAVEKRKSKQHQLGPIFQTPIRQEPPKGVAGQFRVEIGKGGARGGDSNDGDAEA